jgi:hypothetical protein
VPSVGGAGTSDEPFKKEMEIQFKAQYKDLGARIMNP